MAGKATGQADRIEVRDVLLGRMLIEVAGLAPGLLVNRFGDRAQAQMAEDQQRIGPKSKNKEVRDPEAEFEDALYRLDPARDGATYGFPAIAFKLAMIRAAGDLAGQTMTKVRPAFFVDCGADELLPIRDVDPIMDVRRVRYGGQTTDLRYRPLFPEGWRMTVPIEYNPQIIGAKDVANLLNAAGSAIGIGELRPSSKGSGNFGRFRVMGENEQ